MPMRSGYRIIGSRKTGTGFLLTDAGSKSNTKIESGGRLPLSVAL
jgi:hypothetical protein